MTSSLKIGAVSGLVAGIVGGLLAFGTAIYLLQNKLSYNTLETLSIIPMKEIAIVEISFNIVWGIVLGIVFSRVYEIVPGKGISKGIIFGLIYYLVFSIRWATFFLMFFGDPIAAYSLLLWVMFIPQMFVLGICYDFLRGRYVAKREEVTSARHDLKGGFYPGAFAGIVSGITSFLVAWIIINPIIYRIFNTDIVLLLSQLGTLVMFDMIWGIAFGILFAMFYEKVPMKGILKGLVFCITVWFFTNLIGSLQCVVYYQWLNLKYSFLVFNLWGILAGLSVFVPLGLMLGLLYRRPSARASGIH